MKRIAGSVLFLFLIGIVSFGCFGSQVNKLLNQLENNVNEITKLVENEDFGDIRTMVRFQKLSENSMEIAEKIGLFEEIMDEDQTVRFLEISMKMASLMNSLDF
jgi:tRNA 2-selenouridine synthase SelU